MMFYIELAARNVFRRWGRNGLSMVSIVAGVFVLILGRGFVDGMRENIVRAQIDTASGHIVARPADYPTFGLQAPVDRLLRLDDGTRRWLDQHASAWTTRLVFVPRAIHGNESMRVRAFGFDPATDESVFPRSQWEVDGSIPGGSQDGVLVSRGVARALQLVRGDMLILEARTHAGALNAMSVPVSGILTARNPLIDNVGIFVPKPLVQELVRPGDSFSHLAVKLRDRDDAPDLASGLAQAMGPQAEIRTWIQESASLMGIMDIRQTAMDMLAMVLMAIAATGIANTVLMAAYERVREIGTLRAMGMTRAGVVGLFVTEGVFTGFLGALLGGLLGGWTTWSYSRNGIDLAALIQQAGDTGTYDSIPFSTILYMDFREPFILGAMVFGLLVAVLASIYPAVVASRLAPADAVRAE